MIQAHSISWTANEAASRLRTYRRLFAASIITNVIVSLLAILGPVTMARLLGQPEPFPEAWVRIWGATLLGLHVVYLPGLRNPVFYRWPNWASIGIKFWMTTIFLLQGSEFLVFALWDATWGVVLLIAYYRLAQAQMQRYP